MPGGTQCAACLLRIGLEPAPAANEDAATHAADDTVVSPAPGGRATSAVSGSVEGDVPGIVGSGRLLLRDAIARGGVGVVLRGFDPALGREVAVKVLQADHRDRADVSRRFIEEARIAGQLQHPGIVPVYELGALADRRPYFSMKLVKGRTLAESLIERAATTDRAAYLRILLKLAETLAYVHERGVIHLDVKPSNVMVGKHGEVQLMDWGLAQVRPSAELRGEPGTLRSGLAGTPAYMAPERFAPDSGPPDARADVFAFGALLFEVLTGRRLYDSPDPQNVRELAASGPTPAMLAPLESADIEADLSRLARDCLARDAQQRPRDASEIAERLAQHFEQIGARAREAELAWARAEAKAAGERQRRRLIAGLSLAGLALAIAIAAALLSAERELSAVAATEALALQEVRNVVDAARSDPTGDIARWESARTAAERVAGAFDRRDSAAAEEFKTLRSEIDAGVARARADQELLAALERARLDADNLDYVAAAAGFEAAFADAGLSVLTDPLRAGHEIAARPELVRVELIAALDTWTAMLMSPRVTPDRSDQPWQVTRSAADAADPDPFRAAIRAAFVRREVDALRAAITDDAVAVAPARSLWLAAKLLVWLRQVAPAIELLETARGRFPDDFWTNHELAGVYLARRHDAAAALPFATAAVSLRPASNAARLRLAQVFEALDRVDDAEQTLREILARAPEYGPAHGRLANLLNFHTTRYAEAIEHYQIAEELEPVRAQPYRLALGDALLRLSRGAEAAPVLERAAAQDPNELVILCMLSKAYVTQRRLDDAAARLADAEALAPATDAERALRDEVRDQVRRLDLLIHTPDLATLEPLDMSERLALAELSATIHWPATAVRLYERAFEVDPALAADQDRYPRYTAATLAVRAGTGGGQDEPPLSAAERAAMLARALTWLRADLAIQRDRLASADSAQQAAAREWLSYVLADEEFAPVRGGTPTGATAGPEWAEFWREVAALLATA